MNNPLRSVSPTEVSSEPPRTATAGGGDGGDENMVLLRIQVAQLETKLETEIRHLKENMATKADLEKNTVVNLKWFVGVIFLCGSIAFAAAKYIN